MPPAVLQKVDGVGKIPIPEPRLIPPARSSGQREFAPQMQRALEHSDVSVVAADAPEMSLAAPLPPRVDLERFANAGEFAPSDFTIPDSPQHFSRQGERYLGPGRPLIQESWLFRPYSIGPVFGFVQGSPLISNWIRENQGVMGGLQLGWDCSHYMGVETRFTWGKIELVDSDLAIATQIANDDAQGLSPTDPFRRRFDGRRYNYVFFWDGHVLFYPWGDSACRPYLMVGLGATAMSFIDRTDITYKDTLFTVPMGLGVKYKLNDFFAIRMECADYMGFGGGSTLDLVHNVTVTGGLEIRFGGQRRAYWPWNPGRRYW